MDANFWHERWRTNQIGFHEPNVNPHLLRHIDALELAEGGRLFLPLCGKTLDIGWLLANGYRVAGVELSELAVQQVFAELNIQPEIVTVGNLKHYRAQGIDIYVGDIFDVSAAVLGPVEAVYDRAALVALPQPMRERYSQHLVSIAQRAPQLVVVFEYDQSLLPGPPFAVNDAEVRQYYELDYRLLVLDRVELPGGLKGQCPAKEVIWLLKPFVL